MYVYILISTWKAILRTLNFAEVCFRGKKNGEICKQSARSVLYNGYTFGVSIVLSEQRHAFIEQHTEERRFERGIF